MCSTSKKYIIDRNEDIPDRVLCVFCGVEIGCRKLHLMRGCSAVAKKSTGAARYSSDRAKQIAYIIAIAKLSLEHSLGAENPKLYKWEGQEQDAGTPGPENHAATHGTGVDNHRPAHKCQGIG